MEDRYSGFRIELYPQSIGNVHVAKGRGACASVSKEATELGIKVLKDGGNAFDAAFTIAFALALFHPQAGNIGGGGYLLFKEKGSKTPVFINYREKSPSGVKGEFFLNDDGTVNPDYTTFGPRSVCVPGTVKAFFYLQNNYGLLRSKDILLTLSKLSEEGFPITSYEASCLNRLSSKLKVSPESNRIYVKKEGLFQKGDFMTNPNLGKTFTTLAKEGERAFYEGSISEQIERDMYENGGYLSVKDLMNYSIKMDEPVFTGLKGVKVWSVPPEGGGTLLIEILNILNRDDFYSLAPFTADFYHYFIQACKIAFIDRLYYLGDVELKSNKTFKCIFEKEYNDKVFKILSGERDMETGELIKLMNGENPEYPFVIEGLDGTNTTHFSIVDREGNAVSNSYTLNLRYGSKWSVEGAGFLLNGSMDAFSFEPGKPNYFGVLGNKPNLFAPDKRPASYMAPVIVTEGKEVKMVLGTPGGPAIPAVLAEILLLLLGFHEDPAKAIQMGRVHHQAWPDILYKEAGFLSEEILKELALKGYKIQDKSELIGDIHGIFTDKGICTAISDFRREGYALASE